jgi:MFS family permease
MMMIKRRWWRIRAQFNEYPRKFWTLMLASFIDRIGGFMLYPFFTLYITRKFGVGMTTVGLIFGVFSLTGIVGSSIGGALADRLGRKPLLLFGLIVSALSSIWLGLVDQLSLFFAGAVFVGLFSNVGGPAQQAMVADLLPEEQRTRGFAIWRVIVNLSAAIGPAIGGFIAGRSFLMLFIADAILSIIVAVIVFIFLPETRVRLSRGKPETMVQSFRGYGRVIQDKLFFFFWIASVFTWLTYMQMNGTLAVYLRDLHNISEVQFGYIISLNAAMVVLLQFAVTKRSDRYSPYVVMALGTLLYAVGFSMYGYVGSFEMFLLAMVIITFGEMLAAPVGQAVVANLAPEDMRGRYMAFYGFSYAIPGVVGTLMAGIVMDYFDPRWVWYAAGLLGLVATGMYLAMGSWQARSKEIPAPAET